jgi:hypothetical protein
VVSAVASATGVFTQYCELNGFDAATSAAPGGTAGAPGQGVCDRSERGTVPELKADMLTVIALSTVSSTLSSAVQPDTISTATSHDAETLGRVETAAQSKSVSSGRPGVSLLPSSGSSLSRLELFGTIFGSVVAFLTLMVAVWMLCLKLRKRRQFR